MSSMPMVCLWQAYGMPVIWLWYATQLENRSSAAQYNTVDEILHLTAAVFVFKLHTVQPTTARSFQRCSIAAVSIAVRRTSCVVGRQLFAFGDFPLEVRATAQTRRSRRTRTLNALCACVCQNAPRHRNVHKKEPSMRCSWVLASWLAALAGETSFE